MSSFRYFISFFGCNPNIHACIRPILDSRFPYIRVNYTYTQERDPAELSITTGFRDAYIPMASILSGETPCDVLFFTSPVAPNGFGVSPKIFQQKGIKLIYVPYATEFLRTGYLRWFMTLPHLHADVILPHHRQQYCIMKNSDRTVRIKFILTDFPSPIFCIIKATSTTLIIKS